MNKFIKHIGWGSVMFWLALYLIIAAIGWLKTKEHGSIVALSAEVAVLFIGMFAYLMYDLAKVVEKFQDKKNIVSQIVRFLYFGLVIASNIFLANLILSAFF